MLDQWFKCKGCGEPCVLTANGSIGHSKPERLLGVADSVPCELYRRCSTRAFFMEHMAGEPLEAPTSMDPVLDGFTCDKCGREPNEAERKEIGKFVRANAGHAVAWLCPACGNVS